MREILIFLALAITGYLLVQGNAWIREFHRGNELREDLEKLRRRFERERFESADREEQERILRRLQFNNLNK